MNDDDHNQDDRTAFVFVVILAVLFYAGLAVWWA